ncbi:hypothetical protein PLEOSDRAFT_1101008 [Pleurotus ostreatus PC15]|uniref:Small secreted protein n=1 Tax=Pleurotus ostreatus (strain PC15) TaxID=1137138 RepID=A0A067NPX6_PLEO1|nr:hypothetical protein PLEOSDRAFT_1101008 [Pleurotus ostreatus PC15]
MNVSILALLACVAAAYALPVDVVAIEARRADSSVDLLNAEWCTSPRGLCRKAT